MSCLFCRETENAPVPKARYEQFLDRYGDRIERGAAIVWGIILIGFIGVNILLQYW